VFGPQEFHCELKEALFDGWLVEAKKKETSSKNHTHQERVATGPCSAGTPRPIAGFESPDSKLLEELWVQRGRGHPRKMD
jgi:hypothetical protein